MWTRKILKIWKKKEEKCRKCDFCRIFAASTVVHKKQPANFDSGGYSETWLRALIAEAWPSITGAKVNNKIETSKWIIKNLRDYTHIHVYQDTWKPLKATKRKLSRCIMGLTKCQTPCEQATMTCTVIYWRALRDNLGWSFNELLPHYLEFFLNSII